MHAVIQCTLRTQVINDNTFRFRLSFGSIAFLVCYHVYALEEKTNRSNLNSIVNGIPFHDRMNTEKKHGTFG